MTLEEWAADVGGAGARLHGRTPRRCRWPSTTAAPSRKSIAATPSSRCAAPGTAARRRGYEVLRVDFENGEPVGFEPFLEGFLIEQEDGGYGYLARLAGLAVGDRTARSTSPTTPTASIYRIAYARRRRRRPPHRRQPPNAVPQPPPSDVAMALVEAAPEAAIAGQGRLRARRSRSRSPMPPTATTPRPPLAGSARRGRAVLCRHRRTTLTPAEPKPFVHWLAYDIPAAVTGAARGPADRAAAPRRRRREAGHEQRRRHRLSRPEAARRTTRRTTTTSRSSRWTCRALGLDPAATREEVLAGDAGQGPRRGRDRRHLREVASHARNRSGRPGTRGIESRRDPDGGMEGHPAWRTYAGFVNDHVMLIAAGVTFYALLALVPALTALVSLYGLFADPASLEQHMACSRTSCPSGGLDIVSEQLQRLAEQRPDQARADLARRLRHRAVERQRRLKAMFEAMNVAYDEEEKRELREAHPDHPRLHAGAIAPLLAPHRRGRRAAARPGDPRPGRRARSGPRASAASSCWSSLLVAGLAALYRWGPSRPDAQWRWITPGAIVAMAVILIASASSPGTSPPSAPTTRPTARSAPSSAS